MFDGLRTEQDIWKNCINMIISLLGIHNNNKV
jgi:hypothetical protein